MPGESSTSPTGLGYTDYSVYHDYVRIADIPDQSNYNSNLSSNSKSKNLSNVCDSSNVDNLSKPGDSSKPPGSSIIATKEGRDLEKINRILYTTNPIKNKLGRVGFSSGYEMSISDQ